MTAEPLLIRTNDGELHSLPGAADIADKVQAAPVRYVLDDASAALVSQTAFAQNNTVSQSIDLLRFPSTSFWLEWNERERIDFLREHGLSDLKGSHGTSGRAGALVRASDDGKRGEISIAWENQNGAPDVSPMTIVFDFGDAGAPTDDTEDGVWRMQLGNLSELNCLYDCARFRLAPDWNAYLKRYSSNRSDYEKAIRKTIKSISSDFAFITAFCLLLSAQGALRFQSSDLSRLNTSRLRKGATPLLEHVNVRLDLLRDAAANGANGPGDRSSPRLHHVCGHLVRRQDSLFWRRAHLRGNPSAGVITARTVNITAATPKAAASAREPLRAAISG